jgi:hypothetical protein
MYVSSLQSSTWMLMHTRWWNKLDRSNNVRSKRWLRQDKVPPLFTPKPTNSDKWPVTTTLNVSLAQPQLSLNLSPNRVQNLSSHKLVTFRQAAHQLVAGLARHCRAVTTGSAPLLHQTSTSTCKPIPFTALAPLFLGTIPPQVNFKSSMVSLFSLYPPLARPRNCYMAL